MVATGLLTLGFGVVVFLVSVSLYERRRPDHITQLVQLSLSVAFLVQLLDGIVVDGTWGLVTVTVPDWMGKLDVAIALAFFTFPGYVVWRWAPRSAERLDTNEERRLYRYRWVFYGLSILMGGAFVLVFAVVISRTVEAF